MEYNFNMGNGAENRFNRKKIALIALIVCIVAILACGTIAYFTDEETQYNVITTPGFSMELREETDGGLPFPEEGISGVMPGDNVTKKVYVENTGDADFYVRIAVEKQFTPDTLDVKYISLDINNTDWTEKDGYYYYNKAVKPGKTTTPLFTKVSFAKEMPNEYQECKAEVIVSGQCVQSKNNGSSVFDAIGWPL